MKSFTRTTSTIQPLAAIVSILLVPAAVQVAEGRSLRIDDTLQEFQVAGPLAPPGMALANDGSAGPIAIQSYQLDTNTGLFDPSAPLPFSINLFGTLYTEFFINENGTVTFGAPFGGRPGSSDFTTIGAPVLAPFFADVDTTVMPFGGAVSHGFFPEVRAIAINWNGVGYQGQDGALDSRRVAMQIVIFDESDVTGVPGDFRLEFNYEGGPEGMAWETGDLDGGTNGLGGNSARVGLYDGAGLGFEVVGSGVPGALLGGDCVANPLALSCNDYFYEFRDGIPFDENGIPLIDVAQQVSIDIQPLRKKNRIAARQFFLPVAVLTDGEFDALQVDPSTVKFGPGDAAPRFTFGLDVDFDHDADLLFLFRLRKVHLPCGTSQATLTAETYAGDSIEGTDTITVKGCH